MAAISMAVREIQTLPDQRVIVRFSSSPGGTPPAGFQAEVEYQNLAEIQGAIRDLILTENQALLLHLAITWLQPNGNFGNINQVTNKTLLFDTTAAPPLGTVTGGMMMVSTSYLRKKRMHGMRREILSILSYFYNITRRLFT